MRYWVGVASKEHVVAGVDGGFCQLCHGKAQPLKRMEIGDFIVYYSAKLRFGKKEAYQKFTAIGRVIGDVYPFQMSEKFISNRRDVQFYAVKEASIQPLIDDLQFIPDKKRWGYPFRYGHLEINKQDFLLIAKAMGLDEAVLV